MAMKTAQIAKAKAAPFIKWAGGKGKLIPQYEPHFPPEFKRYFEPFLGGGAIFYHLADKASVLSDRNPELINCYRVVQNQIEDLLPLLQEYKERHGEEFFLEVRANKPSDRVQRAAWFIYLNKTAFNGLYRENNQGVFNVPSAKYKSPAIFQEQVLRDASTALGQVSIQIAPYQWVEFETLRGDFVYFDPPYDGTFSDYTSHGFDQSDHIRLRDLVKQIASKGVMVMISNSDTEFVRELYKGFEVHQTWRSGTMNSKGSDRGKKKELIIKAGY